ncbi:Rft-1-domain-containing protein [Basidiobolus meristosporus CBS 931.73]|uniref:Man(5)GlcNAc(2)-PP-dolichol translocation protein RFT1 n=1 Tax=Basidiobolus meristosporus CBS 931.73 TaxID=1314790 RepID=A0A1Y1YEZ6_9FUNG|nr:Rft-1-domain-containing protein [Basidiobolus meristosporus CBS 931.73]|eukprot:ORX96611.1 Rft-1-domain-containing protein [Basidiobolus meristosporus CBS 931.73]
MLTFLLNQILLRFTTPTSLGIAYVQLELLIATILFLTREGVRCALLRNDESEESVGEKEKLNDSQKNQLVLNLAYLPLPLGTLVAFLSYYYYLYTADPISLNFPYYGLCVALYGLSSVIELLFEPLYIIAQNKLLFKLRVSLEGSAVITRCVITLSLTILGAYITSRQGAQQGENVFGILSFAIAQLCYSTILLVGYVKYFLAHPFSPSSTKGSITDRLSQFLPRPITRTVHDHPTSQYFDPDQAKLGLTLTKQSLLKHVLTEGDKMLTSWLSIPYDQGIYAFVFNYGSLVPRILFQPVEETARLFFSRLLNGSEPANSGFSPSVLSARILATMIKFHIILGGFFIAFGSNYTHILIDMLAGATWSSTPAPRVLAFYCIYVPIMGVNGIVESFVQAVANPSEISRHNKAMIGFSVGFITAGVVFMKFLAAGAVGLVLANCFNLAMRIAWAWDFIHRFYKEYHPQKHSEIQSMLSFGNTLPSPYVCAAFVGSWAVTNISKTRIGWTTMLDKVQHISVGVLCLGVVVVVIYQKEYQFLQSMNSLVRHKKLD